MTYRLLDRSTEGLQDFLKASSFIEINSFEEIRLDLLKSLCVVDVKDYVAGQRLILVTLNLIKTYKNDENNIRDSKSEKNGHKSLTINTNMDEVYSNNLCMNSYDLYDKNQNTFLSLVTDKSALLSRWDLIYLTEYLM
jgi:hypothetical protein